ncbi:MAG TPA: substrate-binding domain-containing protein [Pyrinomonadaceae bacterium]|nr:substrate-binding domain-containing protein [Pyrinomonadaceae bacterium]
MRHSKVWAASLLVSALLAAACVSGTNTGGGNANGGAGAARRAKGPNDPVKIGFSMDTLKEERWQRDKELVEKHARERGVEVLIDVANGDDRVQLNQAENMLTRGVDVLIVAPHNGEVAASIVEAAHRQGVPVISYDRLIRNSDVDLYISSQVVKIGEMQADYLLRRAPRGNYVIVQGSATDNNARLLHEGHMNVLKPAIDRGDIRVVANQPAREWLADEALKIVENALTRANNDIVAVVASNDGTARGAIQALANQGLAGKVFVSGQDADLASMREILQGRQTMTVYKPIEPLARSAVEAAIKLARGETVETNGAVNNGRKDVPAVLHDLVAVDKDNILQTVVKDGYHKLERICEGLPADKCPRADSAAMPGANKEQ